MPEAVAMQYITTFSEIAGGGKARKYLVKRPKKRGKRG